MRIVLPFESYLYVVVAGELEDDAGAWAGGRELAGERGHTPALAGLGVDGGASGFGVEGEAGHRR